MFDFSLIYMISESLAAIEPFLFTNTYKAPTETATNNIDSNHPPPKKVDKVLQIIETNQTVNA